MDIITRHIRNTLVIGSSYICMMVYALCQEPAAKTNEVVLLWTIGTTKNCSQINKQSKLREVDKAT